jgi:OHCU decarboxylase
LSETLASFNILPRDEAERRLLACCGSSEWASRVAGGRPYTDVPALMNAADSVWSELTPSDWLEAFAAHPRIGESGGHAPATSHKEQSRVMSSAAGTLGLMADENRRYEARFGHVFLIAAAGRTAEEILAALQQRMSNDPADEIRVAAEEQRKITRLRLGGMLKV